MGLINSALENVTLDACEKSNDDALVLIKIYKGEKHLISKRYDGMFILSKYHPKYNNYLDYISNNIKCDVVCDIYCDIMDIKPSVNY